MNPPANWHPDPTGRHDQRYWDGEQWTEHVFTEGVQSIDPLDGSGAAAQEQEQDHEQQAWEQEREQEQQAATHTAADVQQESSADGLFTDAGETAASPEHAADDEALWSPSDQASEDTAGVEESVAPEVEAEDVVGSLDEVAEGDSPAEEEAAHEEDATPEEAASAPDDDFSDAFIMTPETVSRLVSRQATTEPGTPPESAEPAPATDSEPTPATDAEQTPATEADATQDEAAADDGGQGGVIDAPPPSTPAPAPASVDAGAHTTGTTATTGDLGITGDLVGGAFAEREEAGPVGLQNARLLRCSLGEGPGVIARQGTMVAYQGEVTFERQGAGGVTRALKRAATGEGLAMMRSEGTGDVFFADGGQHVFLLHLHGGPALSVNGRNVLAFSAALDWDIERVKGATLLAGGLFNTTLTGTGWVALVSDGEPVVLRTDEAPTHVDVNALVAWSGGLSTRVTNSVTAKSLVGFGSGEAFQMAFEGAGIVIVQPSEGAMGGPAAS